MVSRLYRLDRVNGEFASTLMGEYATPQEAEAAEKEFSKTHKASWMISSGKAEVRKDGSAVTIAAL